MTIIDVVTAVIGVLGLGGTAAVAYLADRRSRVAQQLATQAEDRAARAEALQTERSDVDWGIHHDWETGSLYVRNIGADEAQDVRATLDVVEGVGDHPEVTRRKEQIAVAVGPYERIGFLVADWQGWSAEYAKYLRTTGKTATTHFRVSARVAWRTPAGAERLHTVSGDCRPPA